ncbi:MAG: DUF6544 family protein [Sandaracinaceae bacterium]
MRESTAAERLRAFASRCLGETTTRGHETFLGQRGTMRLSPGGRWMPFTAEQRFSTDEVSFRWHARVKMAPLITAVVEDAFEDGAGRLDAKVFGRISVAHGEGPELDRGEVQRYLAELPWNPRAIFENRALVIADGPEGTIRVHAGDPEAYVDLELDAEGDVVRAFTTTRMRTGSGPTPWEGRFEGYARIGAARIPRTARVAWIPPEGRFEYFRGEITAYGDHPAPGRADA